MIHDPDPIRDKLLAWILASDKPAIFAQAWERLRTVEELPEAHLYRGRPRKPRCKNGHAFTPENTYFYRGDRACRTCRREGNKRRRQAFRI
jgi:hypothetical protein